MHSAFINNAHGCVNIKKLSVTVENLPDNVIDFKESNTLKRICSPG